eukprot:546698_1
MSTLKPPPPYLIAEDESYYGREWIDEDECFPVIIDNGSYSIKCAQAYQDEDCRIDKFPAIVAYMPPPISGGMGSYARRPDCAGYYAQARQATLNCRSPMNAGVIEHWDDMEKLWHHTFYNEMRVEPHGIDTPRNKTEIKQFKFKKQR